MPVEKVYPHIVKEDGKPARLEDHPRVRVAMIVMDYYAHAYSPDEMCRHYPYLKPAEAYAAMAYYFDHQDELDAEIKAELDQIDRERAERPPSPVYLKLKAKGLL
jgi:uncharacterized protein (DUF433 family)